MKKSKISCLALLIPLLSVNVGCNNTSSSEVVGPYGHKIEEDLNSLNIIEDNYRNYYEIFVYSFRDSNGDGKGDLNGVTEKLDYIKDLGYNGIWLMPIHPSLSYHKYDVNNYYEIDKSYGTMEDLEKLIDECHK